MVNFFHRFVFRLLSNALLRWGIFHLISLIVRDLFVNLCLNQNVMKTERLVYIVAIVVLIFLLFKHCEPSEPTIIKEKINITQEQIDSLKATIKPLKEKVADHKKKRIALKEKETEIEYDSLVCKEIVDNLKNQIKECDSILHNQDKIIVLKDSIEIRYERVIEYKDILIKDKKKLIIGPQLGIDYLGKPYIGIGITYNLFGF